MINTKKSRVLPGFRVSLGITLFMAGLVVILPVSILLIKLSMGSWTNFYATLSSPRVLASLTLTLETAFVSALLNVAIGTLLAYVLIRFRFPGRHLLDALVDLPFALPTAVAGITLTALFSNHGWLGKPLAWAGLKVDYAPLGIIVAMVFVSFPFVVRTMQPVLADLDKNMEEAAVILGANRRKIFFSVIAPLMFPAMLTGFTLAFSRALGEYGSIVFISGNLPFKTEVASFLIMSKLDQYDYAGAQIIAGVMLLFSLLLIFLTTIIQQWSQKRLGKTVDLPQVTAPAIDKHPSFLHWGLIVSSFIVGGVILLVPLGAVFYYAFREGGRIFLLNLWDPMTASSVLLTCQVCLVVVPLNTIFGVASAWALAHYEFRGKKIISTLIDVPLSVSPVIAGMFFIMLFGGQTFLGHWFLSHGIKIIYAFPGLVLVTLFVTFPFVARELIPLMQTQGTDDEEAALVLGARPWAIFFRVTLPKIKWGLLNGVILCLARSMGEFGAVSVVSGHIRGLTNTIPLHVEALYNEYNITGAFAVASILTSISIVTLIIKKWMSRGAYARTQEVTR